MVRSFKAWAYAVRQFITAAEAVCFDRGSEGLIRRMDAISAEAEKLAIELEAIRPDHFDFTGPTGVPLRVVLIGRGDRWGHENCFPHTSAIPTVEFYDRRYDHTPDGQPISEYFLTTFLAGSGGLSLHNGMSDWRISAENREEIAKWLDKVAIQGYSFDTKHMQKAGDRCEF